MDPRRGKPEGARLALRPRKASRLPNRSSALVLITDQPQPAVLHLLTVLGLLARQIVLEFLRFLQRAEALHADHVAGFIVERELVAAGRVGRVLLIRGEHDLPRDIGARAAAADAGCAASRGRAAARNVAAEESDEQERGCARDELERASRPLAADLPAHVFAHAADQALYALRIRLERGE